MGTQSQDLLDQLRSVLATTLDAPVTLVPGTMSGKAWRLRVSVADEPWIIAIDAEGGEALARALTAERIDGPDRVVRAIQDWCSHTLTGTGTEGGPDVAPPELIEWSGAQGVTVAGFQCDRLTTPISVSLGRASSDASTVADAAARPVPAALADSSRFGVLMDIDVPLVVRFGCTDMSLKALSRIGPGSLIDLSRAPEDPVEVLVGGRVVARGEVVVVSGSYGIRIVDVGERAPALALEAK